MLNKALENLVKSFKERTHAETNTGEKRVSLAEQGFSGDTLEWLLKLKYGTMNSVTMALDGNDDSEVIGEFRLLSSEEQAEVEEEMLEFVRTKLIPPDNAAYKIHRASKILAKANKPVIDKKTAGFVLTEQQLRQVIPTNMLLALGFKYDDFVKKLSPSITEFNQDIFNEIMAKLDACEGEGSLGKMQDSLNGLSYQLMLEMVVELYLQMKDLMKRLDSCFTGQ